MRILENKEEINELTFTANVYPFCPIGKDTYGAEITVKCNLGDSYPEYCDLTKEITNFSGKEYTIEQLCDVVTNLVRECNPIAAVITVSANSNTHIAVVVSKKI